MQIDDLSLIKSKRFRDIRQVRAIVNDRHFDHGPVLDASGHSGSRIREPVDRNSQSRMEFGSSFTEHFADRNNGHAPVCGNDLHRERPRFASGEFSPVRSGGFVVPACQPTPLAKGLKGRVWSWRIFLSKLVHGESGPIEPVCLTVKVELAAKVCRRYSKALQPQTHSRTA